MRWISGISAKHRHELSCACGTRDSAARGQGSLGECMGNTAAIDSNYAWARLAAVLAMITVGSAGMYVVVVALPAFQLDFTIVKGRAAPPREMLKSN